MDGKKKNEGVSETVRLGFRYLSDEVENVFDDNGNQNQDEADDGDGPRRRFLQRSSGTASGHVGSIFREN